MEDSIQEKEKTFCLTVSHCIAYSFEEMVDKRVVSFMGNRQKVFKEAFEYYGGKITPSLDYMDIDYEIRLNDLIKYLSREGSHFEYHLQEIKA